MVWFFNRENEEMQVETHFDNETSEFVVTLRFQNGSSETERFASFERCRARLVALEHRLENDRWKNSGPPLFIAGGFRKTRVGKTH